MRPPRRLSVYRLVLSACGCALAPSSVLAETESIRIEYRAVAGCPTSEQFVSAVFARAARARRAGAGEVARTFLVAIERAPSGFVGSLTIEEQKGPTVARKVKAPRCAEVAEALVLSTALAVDPTPADAATPLTAASAAAASAAAASAATPVTAPNASAAGDPGASSAAGAGESATPPRATEAPVKEASAAAPSEASEPSSASSPGGGAPWSYWLSLGPAARTAVSPRVALGGSLSVEARRPFGTTPFGSSQSAALQGALGAELTFLRGASETVDGASSAFQFFLVRPFACVAMAHLATGLSLGPCVGGELGLLRADGSDLPHPETQQRFWAAADLRLRMRAMVGRRFTLALDAGPALALTRYRFVFLNPDTPIYDVPTVGFALGASIGLHVL